jgi:phosphatidylinositol alpha-1,6-mannosyltransferase
MLCRDRWGSLEAEGFGIVFLEAAACGLPVVAGRSGGSGEAVVDTVTGYVVDPESLTEVRQYLRELLDHPDKAQAMGAAGRGYVEREHSYDHLAAQFMPLALGDLSGVTSFDG